MGEVIGQSKVVHLVSNRGTSFSFHINLSNRSWDMSNRVFDFEKNIGNCQNQKLPKKFLTKFLQNVIM